MRTIELNIDLISEELYLLILEEFRKQHPNVGDLDNWVIKADTEKKPATEIYYLFRCDDINRPSILKETDRSYPLTDFNNVYELKSALDLMGINYDLVIEVFDHAKCEVLSNDYIVTNNHKN